MAIGWLVEILVVLEVSWWRSRVPDQVEAGFFFFVGWSAIGSTLVVYASLERQKMIK